MTAASFWLGVGVGALAVYGLSATAAIVWWLLADNDLDYYDDDDLDARQAVAPWN